MPVTELYAFNLICENLLAALYGVAVNLLEAYGSDNAGGKSQGMKQFMAN